MPSLSEDDVRALASAQTFERGEGYYFDGALIDTRKTGDELRASCHGSSYAPYRVSARLGPGGVEDAACTCPYDWGGICKHIVALLLAWVNEPEMFVASAPVDDRLAGKSKEELIALIHEMLKREPELEPLLDLPLNPDPGSPLDLTAFNKQIDLLLEEGFLDPEELAIELGAIVETGNRFAAQKNWLAAGAIYHLVLSEFVPHYDELFDENGDISSVLQECAQGLEVCLTEGSLDSPTRKSWFEAVLEAEFKDIEMGGIDLAYPAEDILVEYTTDEEWREIEARIREKLGSLDEGYSRWRREALVSLLARRLEGTEREGEISDLIFELGSKEQQAFELLRQKRFAEAVAVAEKHFADLPGLVLQFADVLVQSGGIAEAVAYVTSQLETRYRTSYLPWLAKITEKQLDPATALKWWLTLFNEVPNLENYRFIRDISAETEQWDSLRRQLIDDLESQEYWDLLIEIALEEGDVARALALFPRQRWRRLDLEVAQAAEVGYPEESIEIYGQVVDRLIAARGRGNYQEAASILKKVKGLYARLGAQANWERYLAGLRTQNARLSALQDELERAAL